MAFEERPAPTSISFGRKLPRAGAGKTPIIVVTGFLGAGKTTILRSFLKTPEAARSVVIVNEFGDIGIDDALLSSDGQNAILLGNGCLCCRVLTDLQQSCLDLLDARARGAIPSFARIIVETSGLADPVPILQTFMSERNLGAQLYLSGVLAVVDASNFSNTISRFAESRRQLVFADRVLVTKSDLVSSSEFADVQRAVLAISPHVEVHNVTSGVVHPDVLLAASGHPSKNIFYADPVHSNDVETFTFSFANPVNWEAFAQSLGLLSKLRGDDLLRLKGILNVQGCDGPVLIQVVQHVAYPAEELEAWPNGDRDSRVVCIVRNIERDQVVSWFLAAQGLARTPSQRQV